MAAKRAQESKSMHGRGKAANDHAPHAASLKRPSYRKPSVGRKQADAQAHAAAEINEAPLPVPVLPSQDSPQAAHPAAAMAAGGPAYSPTDGQAYSPSAAGPGSQWNDNEQLEMAAKRPRTEASADASQPMNRDPHWPPAFPTLHVGNLPAEWSEEELRAVFENFNVMRIAVRHDLGCAFVDLGSEEDATLCLSSLESSPIVVDGPESGLESPNHPQTYLQVSRAHSQAKLDGSSDHPEQLQAQHTSFAHGPVLDAGEQARLAALSIFHSTLNDDIPAAAPHRELVSYDDL